MQIKFEIPRGLRKQGKKSSYHWWMVSDAPRKASRLPQMTRRNTRQLITNLGLRRMEGSANPELGS